MLCLPVVDDIFLINNDFNQHCYQQMVNVTTPYVRGYKIDQLKKVEPSSDGGDSYKFEQMNKMLHVDEATKAILREIYSKEMNVSVDALTRTIKTTFKIIDEFGVANIYLRGINRDLVNGEHLAAFLRVTAKFKDKIFGWDDALEVAKYSLAKSDIDPEDALFGLL